MKVLVLSTNIKKAKHLFYRGITEQLIYVICRKGKNEYIVHDNLIIEFVGYKNIIEKYFYFFKKANYYIRTFNIDLISTDEPYSGLFIGILLRWKFKIPLNVQMYPTTFENILNLDFKGLLILPFAKFMLRFSDSVRAMCNSHKRMLMSKCGLSGDKIFVIPPSYDIDIFLKSIILNNNFLTYSHTVLFIGRLVPQKDIPTLIKSLKIVKKKIPDVLYLIIGKGPEKNRLVQFAKDLDLSNNIKFLDEIPKIDLPDYYLRSSVFVLPSVSESLGVVLIEAAVCKKPVVTTKTVGAEELIVDGINGYVVNFKDYGSMANRIIHLLENDSLASEMGINNYQRIQSLGYFNSKDNLAKVEDMWMNTIEVFKKEKCN